MPAGAGQKAKVFQAHMYQKSFPQPPSVPPGSGPADPSSTPAPLPAETPLDMPVQRFDPVKTLAALEPEPVSRPVEGVFERRLFLVLGSFLLGLLAAQEIGRPLAANGTDLVDAAFYLLFFGLFAWIAFGFLSAIAGFMVMLGAGPGMPRWLTRVRMPAKRTAVLLPIYNEDVDAVFGRLAAMTASVAAIRAEGLFDFFVLSDSHAEAEPRERAAFDRLRQASPSALYYRRREKNVARKPGNIADWLTRFGAAYECMIVLDADSLMSGAAMARLAAAMEERPNVGLIQTIPAVINGRTFFARWHQFAAVAYGSVASAGLQWWSGSEATFWGHNAIIRVKAFAECCGLPKLTGREPFGGHIMSHDMVEAGLLRRRGWAVHMVMLPEGSYEEFPPTLADHAVRDRRWCQGNLQHLRLLNLSGLHWVSRLQLLMGASAYLTSPLWLMLLTVGLIEPLRSHYADLASIPAVWLFVLTLIMLLGPKILALIWIGVDHDLRAAMGGTRKVLATIALEIPLSMLVAPITMLNQTMAIIDIARGRPSGWATQRREADGLAWRDALRQHRWHVLLGALFALAIAADLRGAWWTLPVAVSLIASPATAMLLSRRSAGDWLRRRGLFLTPQETGTARSMDSTDPSIPETRWSKMYLTAQMGPQPLLHP